MFFRLFLLLLSLVVTPAFAAQSLRTVGPADIRAVPDGSGAGYCLLDQPYENGLRLQVALLAAENSGHMNVGVYVPRAGFAVGERYDLTLQLDKGLSRTIAAPARTAELLIANLGGDDAFLKAMASAAQLSAVSRMDHISFALTNFTDALARLASCANSFAAEAALRARESVFPESLAALLKNAGIKDAVPLSLQDIPLEARPADYAWRTGNLIGGARERQAPQGSTLTGLVKLYTEALRAGCKGKFVESTEAPFWSGKAQLMAGTIACEMAEASIFAANVYILTDTGTFTFYMHQGSITEAADAALAQSKVLTALKGFYAGAAVPAKKP